MERHTGPTTLFFSHNPQPPAHAPAPTFPRQAQSCPPPVLLAALRSCCCRGPPAAPPRHGRTLGGRPSAPFRGGQGTLPRTNARSGVGFGAGASQRLRFGGFEEQGCATKSRGEWLTPKPGGDGLTPKSWRNLVSKTKQQTGQVVSYLQDTAVWHRLVTRGKQRGVQCNGMG